MHPGQFTQIGSPNQKVVDASIRELEYHCEMMDRMGLGADGVMIIHMGVRTHATTMSLAVALIPHAIGGLWR